MLMSAGRFLAQRFVVLSALASRGLYSQVRAFSVQAALSRRPGFRTTTVVHPSALFLSSNAAPPEKISHVNRPQMEEILEEYEEGWS